MDSSNHFSQSNGWNCHSPCLPFVLTTRLLHVFHLQHCTLSFMIICNFNGFISSPTPNNKLHFTPLHSSQFTFTIWTKKRAIMGQRLSIIWQSNEQWPYCAGCMIMYVWLLGIIQYIFLCVPSIIIPGHFNAWCVLHKFITNASSPFISTTLLLRFLMPCVNYAWMIIMWWSGMQWMEIKLHKHYQLSRRTHLSISLTGMAALECLDLFWLWLSFFFLAKPNQPTQHNPFQPSQAAHTTIAQTSDKMENEKL
jgi:hypothetical protein